MARKAACCGRPAHATSFDQPFPIGAVAADDVPRRVRATINGFWIDRGDVGWVIGADVPALVDAGWLVPVEEA